jgi:hypothetical protein
LLEYESNHGTQEEDKKEEGSREAQTHFEEGADSRWGSPLG